MMFPAPVGGWISNRSLAYPQQPGQTPGAAVLDNFIPKSQSVVLRRGKQLYATLGDGTLPCLSLFSYVNGNIQYIFGATEDAVYDVTNVIFPENSSITTEDGEPIETEDGDIFGWVSTIGLEVLTGLTGGNWSTVQFATDGGTYLIGANGEDTGFIFDGTTFYPNVAGGIYGLDYDSETAPFTEGETLTGGTSGTTATIVKVIDDGTTGTLWLKDIVGAGFDDNETITDGGSGDADANGVEEVLSPGMGFGTLDTSDMSYVWVYKNRLWFVQKDSLNAWYMDIASIGGDAEIFPLGGVFNRGGSLLFGQTWSLDSGAEGGLSEQNVFVSTEGEVAVYQGDDPNEASTWKKVGVYRVGKPLGSRGFLRGGGDIAIATTAGLVPLSKAIELDVTSLNVATVSYNIADAWSEAVEMRGDADWQCELWPDQKMAIISPPDMIGSTFPVLFVSNTETGAWARFTGWQALCMEVFRGQLIFGSPEGKIFIGNVGGIDDEDSYTGVAVPLFQDLGSPASIKIGKVGRAVMRSKFNAYAAIAMLVDFDTALPAPPDATLSSAMSAWGTAIWGQSIWGAGQSSLVVQDWSSIGGAGYACSLAMQITSGAIPPLDAELIRLDMTFETAEVVT